MEAPREPKYFIWFTTVDNNLTPQPRPVWFILEGDSLLTFSKPDAYKVAHIKMHPNIAIHFNTDEKADESVIVFLGVAEINPSVPPAHKIPAYFEKYETGMEELNMTPEEFSKEYSLAIRVKLSKLHGW